MLSDRCLEANYKYVYSSLASDSQVEKFGGAGVSRAVFLAGALQPAGGTPAPHPFTAIFGCDTPRERRRNKLARQFAPAARKIEARSKPRHSRNPSAPAANPEPHRKLDSRNHQACRNRG